jgi:two-component system, OmpR family, response regulator
MSNQAKVFIVDDDPMLSALLSDHLQENLDVSVHTFPTGEACLARLDENPDVIVLDYYLNSMEKEAANGLDILLEIKKKNKAQPVIMLSSQESYGTAGLTIAHGAVHYVIKGREAFDDVTSAIREIIENG